jgi:hypothetical protein
MPQETADEFESGDGHNLPTIIILIVTPFERNQTVFDIEDAVIGDSDTVSIPAEVFHNMGRGFKGGLTIDNPILFETILHKTLKKARYR